MHSDDRRRLAFVAATEVIVELEQVVCGEIDPQNLICTILEPFLSSNILNDDGCVVYLYFHTDFRNESINMVRVHPHPHAATADCSKKAPSAEVWSILLVYNTPTDLNFFFKFRNDKSIFFLLINNRVLLSEIVFLILPSVTKYFEIIFLNLLFFMIEKIYGQNYS